MRETPFFSRFSSLFHCTLSLLLPQGTLRQGLTTARCIFAYFRPKDFNFQIIKNKDANEKQNASKSAILFTHSLIEHPTFYCGILVQIQESSEQDKAKIPKLDYFLLSLPL